jgi:hypothetical protein
MILDDKALHWTLKLGGLARAHRWTVFTSELRKQRPEDPSLILLRGKRIVAVYARTSKPRAMPPVERFPDGIEVYVWTPADQAMASAILGSDIAGAALTRSDPGPPPAA